MNSTQYPLAGVCRCGRTGFEISAPPIMVAACHCRGCQRMSSSAFALTAMIPENAFRVTKGEPVKGGLQGPELDHFFCDFCKTWMFTRIGSVFPQGAGVDAFVNVRPTLFDDPVWSTPFIDTMTAEKLSWVKTPARHSYEGFPPLEDYRQLLKEFAAHL